VNSLFVTGAVGLARFIIAGGGEIKHKYKTNLITARGFIDKKERCVK
jgi:hypothetical protein